MELSTKTLNIIREKIKELDKDNKNKIKAIRKEALEVK